MEDEQRHAVEGTVSKSVGEVGLEGEVLEKVWVQESCRSCKDSIFKCDARSYWELVLINKWKWEGLMESVHPAVWEWVTVYKDCWYQGVTLINK